jgi:hypothetical protein
MPVNIWLSNLFLYLLSSYLVPSLCSHAELKKASDTVLLCDELFSDGIAREKGACKNNRLFCCILTSR